MQVLRIRNQRRHFLLQEFPFQAAEPARGVVSCLCAVADGEEEVAEGFVVGAAGVVVGCGFGGTWGCCGGAFDGPLGTGSALGWGGIILCCLLILFPEDDTVRICVLQFAICFLELCVPDVIPATGFDEVVVAFFAACV